MFVLFCLFINLFRIPRDPEKREVWANALKGQQCSQSQFVCQHHFQEKDIIKTASTFKLKQNALRSIFSPNIPNVACLEAAEIPIEENNTQKHDELNDNENENLRAEIDHWKEQTELLLIKVEILMKEKNELKNELIMIKSSEEKKRKEVPRGSSESDKLKVLHCLQHGIVRRDGYPEAVRKFCLSMHFHSPAGYAFLREFFNRTLPNPATIRNWYANSDIKCEKGISEYCLNVLKKNLVRCGSKS